MAVLHQKCSFHGVTLHFRVSTEDELEILNPHQEMAAQCNLYETNR